MIPKLFLYIDGVAFPLVYASGEIATHPLDGTDNSFDISSPGEPLWLGGAPSAVTGTPRNVRDDGGCTPWYGDLDEIKFYTGVIAGPPDRNGDGSVNFIDYAETVDDWGNPPSYWP